MTTTEPRHVGETRELRAVDYKPRRMRVRHDPEPTSRRRVWLHRVAVWWRLLRLPVQIAAGVVVCLVLLMAWSTAMAWLIGGSAS